MSILRGGEFLFCDLTAGWGERCWQCFLPCWLLHLSLSSIFPQCGMSHDLMLVKYCHLHCESLTEQCLYFIPCSGFSRNWRKGTNRTLWSMTSVTLSASTLSPTLILTSPTAPMRSTSREPCRGWCEWPSENTNTALIISLSDDCPDTLNRGVCFPLYSFFWELLLSELQVLSYRSKNPAFKEVLTRIEGHPDCRNLPMISFLILPMQRITRLPLLMDVSTHKTNSSTSFGITRLSLLCNGLISHSPLTDSTQGVFWPHRRLRDLIYILCCTNFTSPRSSF